MKSNQIRVAVILGSISIIGIIFFQWYWVNHSYSQAEQQFTRSVKIALYNVAEKMAAFNGHELPNENPVRQISSNYFIVDINDIIDASILDHYLKTEFEYTNIIISYEYAIYDCETDKMVFGHYIDPKDIKNNRDRMFQKYDEFTYYFGIYFPTKTFYILNSMNIWLISSFVLITALIFFAYAIFIIFKQKQLSEIQKDFINNMTHEFKTPIATIGISANVLSNPEIVNQPDRLLNYATIIADQNKRLETQIEKVLQVASIEKNKINLKLEEINVHDNIQQLVKNFEITLKGEKASFVFHLNATNYLIKVDKLHFNNVLYNLVDNAIKYSPNEVNINIETKNINRDLHILIKDKGIGIDKKYRTKIFDRFFRIATGNIHNVKGFGIGLNYVKNVIESHHFRIFVKSEVNVGSTFWIEIPLNNK